MKLWLIVVTAFSTLFTAGWHMAKLPEDICAAVVAAAFGALPVLAEMQVNKAKSASDRLREFVTGDVYLKPAIAALYVLCYLQLSEHTLGFFVGAAIGAGVALAGESLNTIQKVVPYASPLVVLLITGGLMIPVSKAAAHRIKSHSFLWIVGALCADAVLNASVQVGVLHSSVLTSLLQLLEIVFLVPGAIGGYLWARRTQTAFQMAYLFHRLSKVDQASLLDLLQPSREVATGATAGSSALRAPSERADGAQRSFQ